MDYRILERVRFAYRCRMLRCAGVFGLNVYQLRFHHLDIRRYIGGLMEKIIRVKDTLVCLLHEPPKAECGHALSIGMGVVLLFAFIVVCVVMK